MVTQTLEATLGAMIVLIAIVVMFSPITIKEDFSQIGYNCLKNLDNKGSLDYYVLNGMTEELRNDLESCVPIEFDIKICKTTDCTTVLPDKDVYVTSYLINTNLINLWMWK